MSYLQNYLSNYKLPDNETSIKYDSNLIGIFRKSNEYKGLNFRGMMKTYSQKERDDILKADLSDDESIETASIGDNSDDEGDGLGGDGRPPDVPIGAQHIRDAMHRTGAGAGALHGTSGVEESKDGTADEREMSVTGADEGEGEGEGTFDRNAALQRFSTTDDGRIVSGEARSYLESIGIHVKTGGGASNFVYHDVAFKEIPTATRATIITEIENQLKADGITTDYIEDLARVISFIKTASRKTQGAPLKAVSASSGIRSAAKAAPAPGAGAGAAKKPTGGEK